MLEYIYKYNNKYFRELINNITGKIILKEKITESEYLSYK